MATQAFDKARAALASEVDKALASHAAGLPSIAELARRAGVAYVTMWKAVAALVAAGALEARPRRGIRLTGSAGHVTPPPLPAAPPRVAPHRMRWQELRDRIAGEILRGVYGPGDTLPLPKALRQTFGVSHRTLRKAFAALESAGCLTPCKRTFRVAAMPGAGPAARVALVGRGDRSGNLHLFYAQRTQDFFYTLERECSRAGVSLEVYPYDEDAGRLYDSDGHAVPAGHLARQSMLGALFYSTGISDPSLQALLGPLAGTRTPCAVLDETRSAFLAGLAGRQAGFRLYLLGQGSTHGEIMGRYLVGLGHRRVCYVSPMHGSPWSGNRLAGLRAAFAAAGAPDVAAVTSPSFVSVDRAPRLRAVTRRTIAALRRYSASGADQSTAAIAAVIRQIREQVNEIVNVAVPRRELRRLFDQAIRLGPATAWVAANDMVAREMLVYLREKGRDVPGEISVAGFDDTDREFRQDLTSYNFNIPAIVRAMLGFILEWRPARAATGTQSVVELEGFVTPRRTTARPRSG